MTGKRHHHTVRFGLGQFLAGLDGQPISRIADAALVFGGDERQALLRQLLILFAGRGIELAGQD